MKNNISKDIQNNIGYQLLRKLTKHQLEENFRYFVNAVLPDVVSEPLTTDEKKLLQDIANDLFQSGEIIRVPSKIPNSSEDFYDSDWI